MTLHHARKLSGRKQLILVVLLASLLLSGVLFIQALSGFLASYHTDFMDSQAVDYELDEDEEVVTVTLEIENPSHGEFTVDEYLIRGLIDGEPVTYSGRQFLDGTVVLPPDESVEVRISLEVIDGKLETVKSGQLTFDGHVVAEAHEERYFLSVETVGGGQQ